MSTMSAPKFRAIYGIIGEKARIPWSIATLPVFLLLIVVARLFSAGVMILPGFVAGAVRDAASLEQYMKGLEAHGLSPLLLFASGFLILIPFIWTGLVENRSLASIGFTGRTWLVRYARGFIIGAAFLLVVVGAIFAAGGYEVEAVFPVGRAEDPGASFGLIGLFLAGFMIQSAGEETIYRGWWMSALAARRGTAVALIVTSVFFALGHLGNIDPRLLESMVGVANVLLFGLFIGLYALREGSIWGACGWHGAWNWLLGTGFGLEVSGYSIGGAPLLVDLKNAEGPVLLTGGAFGPEASLVATAVLAIGCGWFLLRRRRHRD
ncbi:MAG: lysostaphin resistance A-like protein [Parvularculaceae bacterium]